MMLSLWTLVVTLLTLVAADPPQQISFPRWYEPKFYLLRYVTDLCALVVLTQSYRLLLHRGVDLRVRSYPSFSREDRHTSCDRS
jgi:hypothetical protein